MASPDKPKPSSISPAARVTALVAKMRQKAKLVLPPPDVLERNMLDFATALAKLKAFAAREQRSIAHLAADVELTDIWTCLCENISQRARDFHSIEEYVEAQRREGDMGNVHVMLWQLEKVKDVQAITEAQKRIV
jgi:hypothetical protein